VGLAAYLLGEVAGKVVERAGVVAAVVAAIGAVGAFLLVRRRAQHRLP